MIPLSFLDFVITKTSMATKGGWSKKLLNSPALNQTSGKHLFHSKGLILAIKTHEQMCQTQSSLAFVLLQRQYDTSVVLENWNRHWDSQYRSFGFI